MRRSPHPNPECFVKTAAHQPRCHRPHRSRSPGNQELDGSTCNFPFRCGQTGHPAVNLRRSSVARSVLFVFGTRPEAIKLCPLIRELRSRREFTVRICVTAQHRGMLDQVLEAFEVTPDYDLGLMRPNQTLSSLTARILEGLEPVLASAAPCMVIVQGDTTTTLAAALAAFYHRIPIAHVEAGLRTGDPAHPFPEEINRVLTGRLAELHFAPTPKAAANLTAEGVPAERIHITGNTGIDAVLYVRDALQSGALAPAQWPALNCNRRLIVVTSHRRENFGDGFVREMRALARIAARPDVELVYPVHCNPNVLGPAHELLSGRANVHLLEPLPYVPFVDLLRRAYFLITDSGGIQEEAPSLGKPVLVMREKTERPEAVEAGTVKLVGTDEDRIVAEATRLLDDPAEYARMTRVHNPYGDGHASRRIGEILAKHFQTS
ncbi:MAG: UDP-N-acetylglucosamine 2-epimerase (non-hydrolyzing) [Acidobacteriia bacterium]|nr:UDP-N-acetylglucosamine 2-epimerase (non-hydrolyzing) [Terriglobia bacterium]